MATDPEDNAAFKVLGAVRLKKDCCPAKIEQLGRRLEEVDLALSQASDDLIIAYHDALQARIERETDKIADVLQPFCETRELARKLAGGTDTVQRINNRQYEFKVGAYSHMPTEFEYAQRLLAAIGESGLEAAPAAEAKA